MIKKILVKIGFGAIIGLGTLLIVLPIRTYISQYLPNLILQMILGGVLIWVGLWLIKKYGKEMD